MPVSIHNKWQKVTENTGTTEQKWMLVGLSSVLQWSVCVSALILMLPTVMCKWSGDHLTSGKLK